MLAMAFSLASCGPDSDDSYLQFVGSWGVEHIEYYNIDYAGNPIPATVEVHDFVLGDPHDGIDLIFNSDKKGEMRRRDVDTFYVKVSINPTTYDTIIDPDTTWVIPFQYTFDSDESALYLTTLDDMKTNKMMISNFKDNSFMYLNEYKPNEVEKAFLKRLSTADNSRKSFPKPTYRPRRPGSFLSF